MAAKKKLPKVCEHCGGKFPLENPEACHVLDVEEGSVPPGSPEIGPHFFCLETCVDSFREKLLKKYSGPAKVV